MLKIYKFQKIKLTPKRVSALFWWTSRDSTDFASKILITKNKIEILTLLCKAKLSFLLSFLFYLLSGNGKFREERKTRSEERKVQKETTTFLSKIVVSFWWTSRDSTDFASKILLFGDRNSLNFSTRLTLLAKNSSLNCFLNAQTLTGSSPLQI